MAKWKGLTDSELEILSVLWRKGPSTVREVFDELPADRRKGYTTTLKLMQLMNEKGLVKRNEDSRAHVYEASQDAEESRTGIVHELIGRLFGGSAKALALSALGSDFDAGQLSEIERILEEKEKGP